MDKEERIARRAYNLWCAEGWPKGRDKEHWEQARHEIEGADGLADPAIVEGAGTGKSGGAPQPRC